MAEALGLTWFDVGNAVWIATLAAGGGWVAVLLLRHRSAPAAHAVTVITSGILLLAPVLGWLGSRWLGVVPVKATVAIPAVTSEAESSSRPQVQRETQPTEKQVKFQNASSQETPPVAPTVAEPARSMISLLDLFLVIWIMGCLGVAMPLAGRGVSAFQVRRSMRDVADPQVAEMFQKEAQSLGMKPPSVAESSLVCVPVALGPWLPVVVLPSGFSNHVTPSVLGSVLRHELGHLACRHHAAAFLQSLARMVWWWHPLTWRQGREQAELQEEIADNFALATAPCRQEYASLLLRLAEAAQAVPGPRVGLAMHHRRSGFARRIESLVRKERDLMTQVSRRNRWRLGLGAVASLALLTCLTLRTATVSAQQKEEDPPKQGQGQQKNGSIKTESFRNGVPIPGRKPELTQEPGKPPIIVYSMSRSSSKWLETPDRLRVAVDEGIEWQGKKAFLSLTFDLLMVNTKTGKVVWTSSVGAFWDTITFVNTAKENEAAKWAVALRSSRNPGFQQTYDLETGRKLELTGGAVPPAGTALTPRKVWSGSAGIRAEKQYSLVGSADEWTALRKELFGEQAKDIPAATDVDFSKEMLLVCYMGKATNCRGIRPELVVESDEQVVLRLARSTYQSMGGRRDEYPYGLIVLPRRPGKTHVLEYNRQGLIGGPPMWKEFIRLTLPKEG